MTPSDFFSTFGPGALAVVPWVAGGIAAAIGLFFALLGIRKGLSWFMAIVYRAGDDGRGAPIGHDFSAGFSDSFKSDLASGHGLGLYNAARSEMRRGVKSSFNDHELAHLWQEYGED
jgi:hypothetical protein